VAAVPARKKRLHSIGVRLSETAPEIRMATQMVTANSWNKRPRIPGMNSTGMNTAASDNVMERIVKPISREPLRAASTGGSPRSMCRTMFSSMTMASSTTKPIERVSASNDRLSMLKPRGYMSANVPTIDSGKARLGMIVARTLRRKRKITRTTNPSASSMVNLTSLTEARIDSERSNRTFSSTDGGSCCCSTGSSAFTAVATRTVLVPGCRCTARMTERCRCCALAYHDAALSSSTPSTTCPSSPRRTGDPPR